MKKRRSGNADNTKQIADGTKQIADGKKQIADDTKQNKRRQSSWDPNSVGLGLGYFERQNLQNENNEKMERTGNHQETFNEVARKKLKLDDDQLNDYEKQVKPNVDIEETSQDEQAMEANAENNYSNSVIGNESELMTVSGSRQRSMLDEEKKDGESVRNINADKVNEGVFEGSSDGNGQSSSRNEAQVMYDTACETTNEQADENMDESQNGVLGGEIDSDREVPRICPAFLLLWSMRGTPCFNTLLADFLEIMSDSSEECEEP